MTHFTYRVLELSPKGVLLLGISLKKKAVIITYIYINFIKLEVYRLKQIFFCIYLLKYLANSDNLFTVF